MTTVTEEFVGPTGGDWVQVADNADLSVVLEAGTTYRLDPDKPDFATDTTGFSAGGNGSLIRGKLNRVWARLEEGQSTLVAKTTRELFINQI